MIFISLQLNNLETSLNTFWQRLTCVAHSLASISPDSNVIAIFHFSLCFPPATDPTASLPPMLSLNNTLPCLHNPREGSYKHGFKLSLGKLLAQFGFPYKAVRIIFQQLFSVIRKPSFVTKQNIPSVLQALQQFVVARLLKLKCPTVFTMSSTNCSEYS